MKGLHLNLVFITPQSLGRLICIMLGAYVPWLVGFTREDAQRFYPYMQKNVYDLLRESGYLHIQATKPDTAGNVTSLHPCDHGTLITCGTWKQRLAKSGKQWVLVIGYKIHVDNEFMGMRTVSNEFQRNHSKVVGDFKYNFSRSVK